MIKFFRNIRKKLIAQGKTANYFKYAIGEIVLVMVGILLALQVNNWNENRKVNQFERKVLKEILSDTEEDLKEMDDALNQLKECQRSGELIIEAFHKNIPYNDSMDVHFAKALRLWSLSPNSTAFEAAKSEGLYLIKNDSIRKLVAKINGYHFDYVRVLESRWQDYNTSIVLTYCLSMFDYFNFDRMHPNNFETLKNDATYKGILKSLGAMRSRYVENLKIRYNVLLELNKMIKYELK